MHPVTETQLGTGTRLSGIRTGVFYIATMLFWFSMYTYVPVLTPYVEHLGGSLFAAGLVVGSYGLTQMLVRVPIGIGSDRLGRRKGFVLGGMACATLSSLGFAVTHNVWLSLLFRGLAGVAAGTWVPMTVWFASYFAPRDAPRAMGLLSFYTSLGQMVASPVGGYLAEIWGWHAPFWVGAAGGLLSLSVAAGMLKEPERAVGHTASVKSLLRMGSEWPLLSVSLLAILGYFMQFSTMFGFTPLRAAHLGATQGDLGILMFLTTLPNAVAGYLAGSRMADRIGERATVVWGFAIAALCTAVIPWVPNLSWLYLTQALNGFGLGMQAPILMGLAIRSVPGSRRGTAMGFFQAMYSIGMFGGPFLVGWIGQLAGLSGGFVVVGGVGVLATLLAWVWIRERPKGQL